MWLKTFAAEEPRGLAREAANKIPVMAQKGSTGIIKVQSDSNCVKSLAVKITCDFDSPKTIPTLCAEASGQYRSVKTKLFTDIFILILVSEAYTQLIYNV